VIISDANILSSFAAARGLLLLLDILHEDVIYIPPSVHQEPLDGLTYGVSYFVCESWLFVPLAVLSHDGESLQSDPTVSVSPVRRRKTASRFGC